MVNVLNSALAYVNLNIWKKCFCKRKGRSRARTMYTHSRMRRNTMFQNCVKSTSHAVAGTWTDMCGWAFIAHSSHMRRRRTYLCMRGFLDMGTKFRIQESLPPSLRLSSRIPQNGSCVYLSTRMVQTLSHICIGRQILWANISGSTES